MKNEHRLLELYLKQAEEPELEDFLDFTYRVLFASYVRRTAMETKKGYCIKDRERRGRLRYLEEVEGWSERLLAGADTTEQVFTCLMLQQALETLPEKQGDVLKEFYLEAKDEKKIASERGISRQAVNGLKRRGLAAMRQKLEIE